MGLPTVFGKKVGVSIASPHSGSVVTIYSVPS